VRMRPRGTGPTDTRRPTSQAFARWLPAVLIVGGLAFELLTPRRFTGSPFFSAAPLVAAALSTLRVTVATGVVSVVTVLGLQAYFTGTISGSEEITELATVLTVAALAVFLNRVVHLGRRRLASARGVAEAAQRAVLPTPAPRIGGLHVAARYEAAQAEASIGGDLYAVQDTPHGVRLIIGDVRGKGLDAVEMVAVVIGAFREAAEQETTLEEVAVRLERALQRETARREGLEQAEGFTTAVLAEATPVVPAALRSEPGEGALAGTVRVLHRGHPSPLLLYADGSLREAGPVRPSLPFGMGDLGDLGEWPEHVAEFPFPEGATLLLFTDGVTEARDARGVFYDPWERLRGRLFSGPDALLDALVEDVARHTAGGSTDDMALLAVSRPGRGQPERRQTVELTPASHGP
jgi:hypothetical protein